MSNWFAITPGSVGDHLAVSATAPSLDAALQQARELARTTGLPHRVVQLTEIAVYTAGKVPNK